MASPPQSVYSDRYEPQRLIARGGMAEVWLAHDQLLDRTVALKVLFPELSVDRNFVERFRREAQNAANLSHPNIVSVYDWGEASGKYFIVMEYVDGQPLSAMLRRGPVPADPAATIGADVAGALGFAHRHGVVHRDVKPGNVLLTADGHVKVTDFGIARAANTDDHLTQTGAVMGTATYFSPEQAQGLAVDQRSDVYALGVVLYEMVTGTPPFVAESPVATAYKHVHETPKPPSALNPNLPPAFEAIVLQAMAKDARDRYASAEELRADLVRFRQGRPVLAAPTSMTASTKAPATKAPATKVPAAKARAKPGKPAMRHSANRSPKAAPVTEVIGPPSSPPPTPPPTPPADVGPAPSVLEDDRDGRALWIYGVLLGVLVAALIVVLVLLARQLDLFSGGGSSASSAPLTMPADVVGKQYDAAAAELQRLGATSITRNDVTDAAHSAGVVTAVTPAAGQRVPPSTAITLTVASGGAQLYEPDVIGESVTAATQQLQQAGFVVGNPTTQDSNSVQAGQVMAQNPPAGNEGHSGDSITLTVSDGKGQALVPDETGKTEATAQADLQQADLTSYVDGHDYSGTVAAGSVVRTVPVAGTAVAKTSSVGLILSLGPGRVRVPYVRGEREATAKAQLEAAGLVVAETTEAANYPSDDGVVLSSDPAGGSFAEQGTTVNLVIGQYAAPTTLGL